MSRISNFAHLGLFLSLLPEGVLRRMLFEFRLYPARLRGLRKEGPEDKVEFEFRFYSQRYREMQIFIVQWDLPFNQLTYHLSRREGSSTRLAKNRIVDSMSWMIDIRTLMRDEDWEIRSCAYPSFEKINTMLSEHWTRYQQRWVELRNSEESFA